MFRNWQDMPPLWQQSHPTHLYHQTWGVKSNLRSNWSLPAPAFLAVHLFDALLQHFNCLLEWHDLDPATGSYDSGRWWHQGNQRRLRCILLSVVRNLWDNEISATQSEQAWYHLERSHAREPKMISVKWFRAMRAAPSLPTKGKMSTGMLVGSSVAHGLMTFF